jgi:hypothetical protein
LTVINLDTPPSPAAMKEIAAHPAIVGAQLVHL